MKDALIGYKYPAYAPNRLKTQKITSSIAPHKPTPVPETVTPPTTTTIVTPLKASQWHPNTGTISPRKEE